jgi:hypothetical protein
MEKQVVYEISETTQLVINGLMQNIAELKQEVSELRHWEEAHLEKIAEMYETLEMYKFTHNSQRMLIVDLKEQLKASESWFDQTVGI